MLLNALGVSGIQSRYMCSSLSQPCDKRLASILYADDNIRGLSLSIPQWYAGGGKRLTIPNDKPPALLEDSPCFTYAEALPECFDRSKPFTQETFQNDRHVMPTFQCRLDNVASEKERSSED